MTSSHCSRQHLTIPPVQGVSGFGKARAHSLARQGFGDQLLQIFERRHQQSIQPALARWRESVNAELPPNLKLPLAFPDLKVLENYASPCTSASTGRGGGGAAIRDTADLDLARIAGFCEASFGEWGHKSAIVKRFRDLLWEAAVIRVLRRAALEADEKEKTRRIQAGMQDWAIRGPLRPSRHAAVGTPYYLVKRYLGRTNEDRIANAFVNRGGHRAPEDDDDEITPLIGKISKSRRHVSTDGLLEYRVQISPAQLVALTCSGIKGTRPEPAHAAADFDDLLEEGGSQASSAAATGWKKPPPHPETPLLMWIPASMMCHVHPGLVEDFEAREAAGRAKKADRLQGKKVAKARGGDSSGDSGDDARRPETAMHSVAPRQPRRPPLEEAAPGEVPGPGPSRANAPLDPWFVADEEANRADPHRRSQPAFLFTFPNPDDPDALRSPVREEEGEDARADDEDDAAPDLFDRLFDQIMGVPGGGASTEGAPEQTSNRKRPMAVEERSSAGEPSNPAPPARTAITQSRGLDLSDDDEEEEEEDDVIPDRFDRIFDQVMGRAAPSARRGSGRGGRRSRARSGTGEAAGHAVRGRLTRADQSWALNRAGHDDANAAPDRFDRLFDQAMGASARAGSGKARQGRTKRRRSGEAPSTRLRDTHRTGSERRPSERDGAASSSRSRIGSTSHARDQGASQVDTRPFGGDTLGAPAFGGKSRLPPAKLSSRPPLPPTSSQESSLFFNDADVVIDIT
jgi:hypothetical protein